MSIGVAWLAIGEVSDEALKAAFLFKFGQYVDWPATVFQNPTAKLRVGIVGEGKVRDHLLQLVNRPIRNRDWDLITPQTPDEMADCQILFVTANAPSAMVKSISGLDQKPILIVSESDRLPGWATINFMRREDKLRFEISRSDADRRGLVIAAALLKLADKP